ncbi:MAG: F0F1 ATP synthase subunit alpha [Synergistaceae bacterium]|jgi:F-type H+-transporting ATPase subunit alpha|nr:F0F1 ATP synthase subunit alpha [Synergistaceae bacterium]
MNSGLRDISSLIKNEVLGFIASPEASEVGRVMQVGDGIIHAIGLDNVMSGELVRFDDDVMGIAMNLELNGVSIVLLGGMKGIREGALVRRTGKIAEVPAGDALLGRVVNAIGEPLDRKGPIRTGKYRPIERVAPGVLARRTVNVPLLTGIKAIDSMIPIGRGQRQLIIGDRQTGKTAIAVDTIINQRDKNVKCVYVAIGQKMSTVADITKTLADRGALDYTVIVAAGAAEPVTMQYLSPYSGVAMGEEWMQNGDDVLIVYDDLSKHAAAYRTMSLLLRRPPGREAYPGDVFYLHSRLLERAGRLNTENGGGSITALPIIETQAGDMSAYIPTNVISITDGQIYLETVAFNSGIRPAINPGLSVSRVGSSAQVKAMKKIAAPIRMELAQYRELASFAQFSSDLDDETRARLRHGERIVETLKQEQFSPFRLEDEILVLYATVKKYLNDVNIEKILPFENGLVEYFRSNYGGLMEEVAEKGLEPDLEGKIIRGIEQYRQFVHEEHIF